MIMEILRAESAIIAAGLAVVVIVFCVFMAQRSIKRRLAADQSQEQARYLGETASAHAFFYNTLAEHQARYAVTLNAFRLVSEAPRDEWNADLERALRKFCECVAAPSEARAVFEPGLISHFSRLAPNSRRLISSYNGFRLGIAAEMKDNALEILDIVSSPTADHREKLDNAELFARMSYSGLRLLSKRVDLIMGALASDCAELTGAQDAALGDEAGLEPVTARILEEHFAVLDARFASSAPDDAAQGGVEGDAVHADGSAPGSGNRTGAMVRRLLGRGSPPPEPVRSRLVAPRTQERLRLADEARRIRAQRLTRPA